MSHRTTWFPIALFTAGALSLGFVFVDRRATAEEPFQAFLDGLRERQLYDAALDYLAEMKNSPLLNAEKKQIIPFEEGRTLISQAADERDLKQKNLQLDAARERLDAFVKANSVHPLLGEASMQLGLVTVERGRLQVDTAFRPSNSQQKDALLKQARDFFDAASKVFDDAEKKFKAEWDAFPRFIEEKDTKQIAARDQARKNLIQAQLYAAAVKNEKAKTYPAGSPDAKKILQEAADKYQSTYEMFRRLLVGLTARIKQGQCYQEMGDPRRALGLYADILNQPDEDDFRKLKASALYLSMQCWLTDTEKKAELAGLKGEEWLKTARGTEDRQPDWLAIRYYTALAEITQAEALDPKDTNTPNKKKSLLAAAREHANFVARIPGLYKDMAKALVPRTGGKELEDKEPTNFAEAMEKATRAYDKMAEKNQQAKLANDGVLGEKKDVPGFMKEAADARAEALKYFRISLGFHDENTTLDDTNTVRQYLSVLEFYAKNFYEAAILGEFLATRYPNSGGARQGATVALASYLEMYNDPDMLATRAFERQRMTDIAEYMLKRWPGESETDDAWDTLMRVSVGENNLKAATDCLAKIPDASGKRGAAELRLGQSYWNAYLIAQAKEDADRLPQAELDKLSANAIDLLEKGMARMKANVEAGGAVTVDLVAAALSASQIYLASGKPDKAVALLEDTKIGPLVLSEKKDPIVLAHAVIPVESHKAALRGYVGVQQLDKAEKMMNALEELVKASSGDAAQADLTKIFISMGKALEEQMTSLRRDGKTEELGKVAKGFELFLEKISKREQGNNFQSLNWVSETFFSLGAGYDTQAKDVPAEALAYYTKTLETDKRILDAAKKDKTFLPQPVVPPGTPASAAPPANDAQLAVEVRTARCLRRMKKYSDALTMLEAILKAKPMLVDAQTEAAQTLMDRGSDKPLFYNLAIAGALTQKDPKTGRESKLMWGWAKLANMLPGKDFQDASFNARYNMANCRVLQAEKATGEEKTRFLKDAEGDIRLTYKLKPDLAAGKTAWTEKFDSLLKTIQKLLGEKPVGLKAFETPAPTKTPAKTTTAAAK
jgi:hypothetical protein